MSRLVHLVVSNLISGRRAYMIHLIDPAKFFYPTKPSNGSADDAAPMGEFQLTPAAMTLYGASQLDRHGAMEFMPLGEGSKNIVAVDHKCRTILCDVASHTVSMMPAMHSPKILPITIPVGDSVYVIRSNPSAGDVNCFEALICGRGPGSRFSPDWYWHSLPPPRIQAAPSNSAWYDDEADHGSNDIGGHALVDSSHIWLSAGDAGTYSFSTVAGKWSKLGDWEMPFSGRVEYIPELNLSLGFSSKDNLLCASDLTAGPPLEPPKLVSKWVDVVQQQDWMPVTSNLVPLGSGKVFIAKFFETREKRYIDDDYVYCNCQYFAVFTGLELENKGGELRMWKHKSARYNPGHHRLHWVI